MKKFGKGSSAYMRMGPDGYLQYSKNDKHLVDVDGAGCGSPFPV
jgi:hypothetical protein